ALQEIRIGARGPVLALVGAREHLAALEALRAGAQDCLLADRIEPSTLAWRMRQTIETSRLQDQTEQLLEKLHLSTVDVQRLRRLLPICASCKKIRDDHGYWSQLEDYFLAHG